MKIAIITDQHFGCRKNSKHFHDYFLKFYNDVFFPTLEKEGITTIVDMGDTFDSRKGVDFSSLAWAKDHYFDLSNARKDLNFLPSYSMEDALAETIEDLKRFYSSERN